MSDISLIATGGRLWLSDHTPGSTEPTVEGIIDLYDQLVNINTNEIYFCADNTPGALIWHTYSDSLLNTTRSYSSQSVSFNTPRNPNITNDTFVLSSVQMSITMLQTSTIDIQIDFGSGYVTIGTSFLSGIDITDTKVFSFIVPKNCYYKIVSSGTGSNSIVSVYEISL